MFRSATFKLTAWYLMLVMAISLIFSAILYNVTTGELDRGLHRESVRITQQFPVFQNSPMLQARPDYDNARDRILWRLVTFNGLVFVAAGFASYWLARRTMEPIEAAHEQQKRFTADVSHELRTPLTAIRMESEVALMSGDAKVSELRQTIISNLEETAKLETLINNLLKLTRLEAEELQQNFQLLHSRAIIDSAMDRVSKLAVTKQITITSTGTDFELSGDSEALTQLLIILLDNAIKYSPEKSKVNIEATLEDQQAVISVVDEGTGIERNAMDHIFDRFYRAESSRAKNKPGYGLGLSIAKMIVDRHNGQIELTSQAGQGTTASVHLPLPS